MLKLVSRYIKPFAFTLLGAIVLLFVQAQTELALPDYMSDIVNTGIQSGGIENGVMDAISESEYEKLAIFMNEEEQKLFEANYQLVTPKHATAEQIDAYPIVATENIYVLDTQDRETIQQLNAVLVQPEMMVLSLQGSGGTENPQLQEMLDKLPEGMSVFDAFAMMPASQIEAMKQEMSEAMTTMGESTLNTAAANFVKMEYSKLGVDIDALQNQYILISGLKMLGMSLLSGACAILVGLLASRIAAGLSRDLRFAVFSKVEQFSNTEFNRFSTASLITRNTNDIQQIQMVIVMLIRIVIYAPIIGIGALIKVVNSQASMTWIIGLVLVVLFSMILTIFVTVMPKFRISQKLLDRLNLVMREFLEGMPVIRAFHTEKYEEQKFDQANMDITKTNLFINRAMALMMPLMMFIMNAVALLIIWVGGHEIDAGNMQIGDMMAFIQYTMQIIMAFLMLSMVAIFLPRASVAANRIQEVLDCECAIQEPKQPKAFAQDVQGCITFEHVSFRYPGAEEDVLHDISFSAKPGETTAFIGSTGSGKSTLVNLVPRFYDVSEGRILVDGMDIREVETKQLRDKIGYVPQKGVLFSGTIASNLRYAKADASEEELALASKIAQAEEFIASKPERYEEPISQGGTNVSGGQKQRLSIARALVKQPEIYIFDDSFSALDFKTDAALRKELNALCKKTQATVLLVAQRVSSIMHADRIIVLDQGHVAGIGTHQELLKSCSVYQEIASSQLSKEELNHEQ